MAFQKPKGTVDYFPQERAKFNYIVDKLKAVAKRYNFSEIESPVIESTDLFKKKSGDEISSQLFNLEKKGSEELSLRPEITPATARMFVEKQKEITKPVKWCYISRNWRYEAPQKGRLREFYQFGCELFGSDKSDADAEVIAFIIDCFKELGLTGEDVVVKINNRNLLQGLIEEAIAEDKIEDMIRAIDKKTKISDEAFEEEIKKIEKTLTPDIFKFTNLKGKPSDVIKEIEKLTLTDKAKKGIETVKTIVNFLKGKEEFVVLDLSVARGLAYYTGTVFEVFDKSGELRSLAGGGRYDNLIELFGGNPEPATGFAIGLATTSLLMEQKKLFPEELSKIGPDYYIAPVNDEMKEKAMEIASKLREKSSVEVDLMQRKLGKQMQFADSINAKKVIIVGPDEVANGEVSIKDLKSGKEEKVKIESLEVVK